MKASRIVATLLIFLSIHLLSCKKETGDNNTPNSGNCNNTVMKFKMLQSLGDPDDFLGAEWNSDGTCKKITMRLALSYLRTATFVYESNKIKQAIIREFYGDDVIDTAFYHYNADGQVDSMYFKNDDTYNIKLTYTAGKLTKYTHFSNTRPVIYWDVETDVNGNITKGVEWADFGSGFEKQWTYTYTRDDRKNPLSGLAPFMLYLDDVYNIFEHWGPNNYVDQSYQDHTGSGLSFVGGFKYQYNENCYPINAETTINGVALLGEPTFEYSYY